MLLRIRLNEKENVITRDLLSGEKLFLDIGIGLTTEPILLVLDKPISPTGLRIIYWIYKQFQRKAGLLQIESARIGLTHDSGRMTGSLNAQSHSLDEGIRIKILLLVLNQSDSEDMVKSVVLVIGATREVRRHSGGSLRPWL